jgi:serine protease inhibitor
LLLGERTRPLPFTGGNGKKSNLPTMTSLGTLLAASGSDFDAVQLALQSPEHHLCVVLPKPGQMATLQSSLGARLSAIRGAFHPIYAELQLPRYTVENTLSLRSALTSAGVVTAFSNSADFGAMSEGRVYLDEVLQNVTFEVNERGLRAASATVASFPSPAAPKTPVLIQINRPFLFLLLNVRTGARPVLGQVFRAFALESQLLLAAVQAAPRPGREHRSALTEQQRQILAPELACKSGPGSPERALS